MQPFDLHLYARPDASSCDFGSDQQLAYDKSPVSPLEDRQRLSTVEVFGQSLPTWNFQQQIGATTIKVSFEQLAERLGRLPRMFFELDGSFVWRGEHTKASSLAAVWQIDGMVYDVSGQIARVEIKGECSRAEIEQLVDCLAPSDTLVAHSLPHSCFVLMHDLLKAWPE